MQNHIMVLLTLNSNDKQQERGWGSG